MGVKLELSTDYEMLLMAEKGLRGGICQASHRYAKTNNKYMKNHNKSIESSYIAYSDAKNLYGWTMSHKLLINGFEWVKNLSYSHKNFKTSTKSRCKTKKVHRVIQFKQEAWLKPYTDMNTELRTEAKNKFEIDFFKLMNNSIFGKTSENQRNHKDIKLLTSDKRRKKLISEPNYHSHKNFSEHLMAIEIKRQN